MWNGELMECCQINRVIDMVDGEYGWKFKFFIVQYVDFIKSCNIMSYSMLEGGDFIGFMVFNDV